MGERLIMPRRKQCDDETPGTRATRASRRQTRSGQTEQDERRMPAKKQKLGKGSP